MRNKIFSVLCLVVLLSVLYTSIDQTPFLSSNREEEGETGHECVGLIATGTSVRDNRSILTKHRWLTQDNQRPIFDAANRGAYNFWGVGDNSSSFCRMGMNEIGLAIANFDPPGDTLDAGKWEWTSDRASGSEDNDMRNCLANYSTVAEAAYYLAQHAYYSCQWIIISDEPGVGAVVAMDSSYHVNITWINNTYAGISNAWYCEGSDTASSTRLNYLISRAVSNELFWDETQPSKMDIKDVFYLTAHDCNASNATHKYYSEPHPGLYNGFYAKGNGVSTRTSCRSAMFSISGYDRDGDIAMSWLCFGDTIHLTCGFPLGASYVDEASDINSLWDTGIGIQQYTDIKQAYAEYNSTHYIREKVHEIRNFTKVLENETFDRYNNLVAEIGSATSGVPALMKNYADETLEEFLDAYKYNGTKLYRKLKIDHRLTGKNLYNFPVLITINSSIASKCDGGKSIQFWSENNATQYNHEIDLWNESGTSVVWLNMSYLSSNEDTVVWFRYNNSGMNDQQNITGTWDSDFIAIYHMNDDTTSTILDSTTYGNDGTKSSANNPSQTEGKIGYGQDFSNDTINCGHDNIFDVANLTAEVWFYTHSQGNSTNPRIMGIEDSNTARPWAVEDLYLAQSIGLLVCFGGGELQTSYIPFDYSGGSEYNSWIHGAWVYTPGSPIAYKNGVNGTGDTDSGTLATYNYDFRIGNSDSGLRDFDGVIDEVRVSNVARNDSWIKASYNTSSNPSAYLTFYPENSMYEVPSVEQPASTSTTNRSRDLKKMNLENKYLIKQGTFGARVFYVSSVSNMTKSTIINLPATYTYSSWFWDTTKTVESTKVYGITDSMTFELVDKKGTAIKFTISVQDFSDYKGFVIVPNPGFFQGDWWFNILNDPNDYYSEGERISTNYW